ncbi:glucose PTS transporter subunit IIA [Mesoplasma coleopterae]|uniref:PTS system, beta-glucoside-specific IIABC component n=1 Tax=Mesoplasma coleopterae TaxID=324078 RepID=A0A2K8P1Z0_9MOLU|nr:glucose PTS transporter subunit IIA [Mesoplasma coleopterae]ATZ20528.1 PTS system, beta-glucoside-specific IIABC component [Mesoplasma coleopterae]
MEIKIYAPVDGIVKKIEDCSDKTFAQKMLGDGFLIIPSSNVFKSIFDEAKVSMIFDTKHAYGLEIQGLNVLIHCGMDTVNLNGEPFNSKVKVGDWVKVGQDLFEADIKKIKGLKLSVETPIVFDQANIQSFFIKDLKVGKVKQGELICSIDYTLKEEKTENVNKKIDAHELFSGVSKYEKQSREINKAVGGKENYAEAYNCMTRLRFSIKNKDLVDEKILKKIEVVKGVIWNGTELQVVIGQDVYKVKDEILKQNDFANSIAQSNGEHTEKVSLFRKALSMFSGIMVKIIPVMVGAGLIQAIIAILIQLNVMPDISFAQQVAGSAQTWIFDKDLSVFWVILFIAGKTSQYFMGIMIAWSAANYFKFDYILGIALGVIMCSPFLFGDGGQAGFGFQWVIINFGDLNTGNPMLDNISKVIITGLSTKIFVIIGAIYLAKRLNDWIKSWIPITLELMFRPFLIFIIVIPIAFFVFLPIWNIFETLFGSLMFYVGKMPLGIGVGIFVGLWQVTVIFGLHMMLAIISIIDFNNNGGQSIFGIAGSVSVWAQVGALIGVVIVTQNAQLKKQGVGMIAAGFLGITEPILYGINLPKKRPLYAGVIAAFVAGALMNVLGVTQRASSGLGVFEAIGFFSDPVMGGVGKISAVENGLFYLLGCAVSFGGAIGLSMFMYKERPSEKKLVKKTISKLFTISKLENNFSKEDEKEISIKLKQVLKLISNDDEKMIKSEEKKIQNYLKFETKIQSLIEKEEKMKNSILVKGKKALKNNNEELANKLLLKWESINFKDKLQELENLKIEAYKLINFSQLENFVNNKQNSIEEKLIDINFADKKMLNELIPELNNDLNSLKINYNLLEPKTLLINLDKIINDKKENIKASKKRNLS